MRYTISVLASISAAIAISAAQPEAGGQTEGPSLLLNRDDIKSINERACSESWVATIRGDILRQATDWPADYLAKYGLTEWSAPWERGGWSGHYICPEHGVRLQYSPEHNICPICKKDFHGWPYDYDVYRRQHFDNSHSAWQLGLAYQLAGDKAYAEKAKKILLAYAEIYPALSIGSHKDWPRPGSRSGGRVSSQTLNESDWVTDMAFAYDLIRETLTAQERALIERDVLRSASDVIARRGRSLGNWTARHNQAHLAVGLAIHDQALVDFALNSDFGFRDQLRRSLTADGVWHEGSWGYHFYALSALFKTQEMVARAGLDVPEVARLRAALDAPLVSALPDGTLPNFNDSGFTQLRGEASDYDKGFRLYGDRRYLAVVRGAPRTLEAMLWGAKHVDEGEVPALRSSVLPETGFAMLRAEGSDHTVAVKFSPYAGGHSHFDQLNFVSYAFGCIQAVDPGSQSYSFPTHKTWDRVTVAHNTLVVDETSQAESAGKMLEWHPGPEATAIRIEDTTSYPQVRLERLFVHTAGYTLDVFSAAAQDGKQHRFDWIYHNAGTASSPLALAPYTALPKANGYQHLTDPRAVDMAADWEATFTQEDSAVRLRMLGEAGTTVVLGNGLGQNLAIPVPFALARRNGTKARFITVLEPFREKSRIQTIRLIQPDVVEVKTADFVDVITIAPGRFKFTRTPLSKP